jgi:hypothetical protein
MTYRGAGCGRRFLPTVLAVVALGPAPLPRPEPARHPPPPAPVGLVSRSDGLDWNNLGIGALGGAGFALLATGGALALVGRRRNL